MSAEVFEIKKGWALDLTGNVKKGFIGVGVTKDIYENDFIEFDAGLYVKKELKLLLDGDHQPTIALGISGRFGHVKKNTRKFFTSIKAKIKRQK